MTPISLGELGRILQAQVCGDASILVSGFATDSRAVKPGDLFLAIVGERVDGHDFAALALKAGAVAALGERSVDGPHLLVPSLVHALGNYGRFYRSSFTGPVIGITGSAGKTTTKELVAAALTPLGAVLKSEGNKNTEYTSPLLWSELKPETRSVVVEMAMRGFGQISHLATIAQPTIGVITNIGYAHLMQMGSRDGIARAKGELLCALPPDGVAVLWAECPYLGLLKEMAGPARVVTFGRSESSDCRLLNYRAVDWHSARLRGVCGGEAWEAELPAIGPHIALDAAAAILTAVEAGVSVSSAAAGLKSAVLPPMRMEIRQLGGATILLDNYNASPPSMVSAIETLAELPVAGRRFAVIGEMRELGEYSEEAHRLIGIALRENPPDRVMFVGDATRFAQEELGSGSMGAGLEDVRTFLRELCPGDAALVKGSRALKLERALEGA